MAQTALLTADDLLCMSEDDRYELVEGVLVPMSPPPGPRHGYVGMTLGILVGGFVRAHRLGWTFAAETGFRLRRNPDTVRAPDFAFVATGRITPEMDLSRYLDLAPDLIAEVMSPSDSARGVAAKIAEYLEAGVRLAWVVDPKNRTVAVHRSGRGRRLLREADELSGEDVLPGFTCVAGDLFTYPDDA
jgi:Uma2 family endonuclease